MLPFIKSVRTNPVYRNIVKTFFKVRSTVTIDCFRLYVQCRCYAPLNTFPIYRSINSVSPTDFIDSYNFCALRNLLLHKTTDFTRCSPNDVQARHPSTDVNPLRTLCFSRVNFLTRCVENTQQHGRFVTYQNLHRIVR